MSFINKLRKVFPTKKVDVNELEYRMPVKSLVKPISPIHKIYNNKLLNESNDSNESNENEYIVIEKEILPESIACPKCGALTIEGLDYCDSCGHEIMIQA